MIDFYSGTFFVIPVKTGIQDVYGVQNPSGYLLSQETHRLSYETPPPGRIIKMDLGLVASGKVRNAGALRFPNPITFCLFSKIYDSSFLIMRV
jgi:hypothetical protein